MANYDSASIFKLMMQIQDWEDTNIPNSKSPTSRKVFLRLAFHFKTSPIKSIKLISRSKDSSSNSVRKVLKTFENNGYIRRERLLDKRTKTIIPNENFERLMHQYALFIEAKVNELARKN
jgi:hypothetical protein